MKSILKEGIVVGSFAEVVRKDLRMIGDVVRFQLEEGEVSYREEKLRRCLVGWFEELPDQLIDFSWLRNFVTSLWSLKRGVKISTFRGALFLFYFDESSKAKRVLVRGIKRFKENFLRLERWHPKVGCLCKRGLLRNFG